MTAPWRVAYVEAPTNERGLICRRRSGRKLFGMVAIGAIEVHDGDTQGRRRSHPRGAARLARGRGSGSYLICPGGGPKRSGAGPNPCGATAGGGASAAGAAAWIGRLRFFFGGGGFGAAVGLSSTNSGLGSSSAVAPGLPALASAETGRTVLDSDV
jgi:hypothetical protein